MIRHIVFFSAKAKADKPEIYNGLMMLSALKDLGLAQHFEVGQNEGSDPQHSEVDFVVYAEFESQAQLDAYRAHDIYKACIARVRPLREMRIAADYEAP